MSTVKCDTLSNAAGASVPVDTVAKGSAKAWCNFNGTGTVAIRASFNVSSITDNGVGDYTINFTTAMPDANYGIVASVADTGGTDYTVLQIPKYTYAPTTSAFRMQAGTRASGAGADSATISVAAFR